MGRLALGLIGITHVLEFRPNAQTTPSINDSTTHMNPAALNESVSAMRIARDGSVGINWTGVSYRASDGTFKPSTGSWSFQRALGDDMYALTQDAVPQIQSLAKGLATLDDETIRRAIDRFNFRYERRSPADRLVDQWIALESLFLPDEPLELKYKAAMRIAQFIGPPQKGQSIFRFAQKSYKHRSKIVHGDPIPKDIVEVMAETQWILRRALERVILEFPRVKLKTLTSQLDDRAASGQETPHDNN